MLGESSEIKHFKIIGTSWCVEGSADLSISILESATRIQKSTNHVIYAIPPYVNLLYMLKDTFIRWNL